MDWLEFISSVVGSVAWPSAAVFLGFMFREHVRKLLDKMKSLKAPGIEASFTEKVEEVAVEAKKVEAKKTEEIVVEPTKTDVPHGAAVEADHDSEYMSNREKYLRWYGGHTVFERERPAALVLNAWNSLEMRIKELLSAHEVHCVGGPDEAIWALYGKPFDVINEQTAGVLQNLLKLRNQVAHVEFEPDRAAALSYVRAARDMEMTLDRLLEQHQEHVKIGNSIESP